MHLVKPYSKGVLAPKGLSEKNDCSVRALANVTGMLYSDCHSIMKELGRKDKEMMDTRMAAAGMLRAGGKLFIVESLEDIRLNHGNYVVFQSGHCFTLIDGQVVDTIKPDMGAKLLGVFKFK